MLAGFGQCLDHIPLRHVNQSVSIEDTDLANGMIGNVCMKGYRTHYINRTNLTPACKLESAVTTRNRLSLVERSGGISAAHVLGLRGCH
jgi:hypothetical protein